MQVVADFGVNGAYPATVGGTGTTVKYFGRNVATAGGATWVPAPSTPSASSPVGALWVPGDNRLNGQRFRVKATGTLFAGSTAGSETITAILYAVTGTQASPVYTALTNTASAAVYTPAVDGVSANFTIEANLTGTTDSGIVGGTQLIIFNNTVAQAAAAVTNALTGINFGNGNTALYQGAPFGLVVGITFSVSNAGNLAKLNQFCIEA